MTAEQALIEENKKDPRARYITYHPELKIFHLWTHMPSLDANAVLPNGEKGAWYCDENSEALISYHYLDLNSDSFIILCIDDIKPEVPPIPEKWYIGFTEENLKLLNDYRLTKCKTFKSSIPTKVEYLLSDDYVNDGSYYADKDDFKTLTNDYKEITLEQFKKYVLKEPEESENNQAEIQKQASEPLLTEKIIENHPIMSIAESEREQSQKEQDEIRQTKVLYPRRMWIEDRINAINQSVKSFLDYDYCIPPEWVEERNELIETLNNL